MYTKLLTNGVGEINGLEESNKILRTMNVTNTIIILDR